MSKKKSAPQKGVTPLIKSSAPVVAVDPAVAAEEDLPSGLMLKMVLQWLLLLGVFLHVLIIGQRSVLDPDFWWHLKTGELMVGAKALLSSDPFALSGPILDPARDKFLLTSYWLSQVFLYLAYKIAGFNGIFALRFFFLSVFAVVYARMYRLRMDGLITFIVLAASMILFGQLHPVDRPNVLTFFCATLLVWLMEKIREGERPSLLLLPLMLVWANLHGGFVIGDVMLLLFAAGSIIEYRRDRRKVAIICGWAAAGIAASFINPNGFYSVAFTFDIFSNKEETRAFVNEFVSTYNYFKNGNIYIPIVWSMVVLTPVGMLMARKRYWPDIFVCTFLAYIAIAYVRNVAFFALVMAPVCGYYLDRGLKRIVPEEERSFRLKAAVAIAMVCFTGYSALQLLRTNSHRDDVVQAVAGFFPVEGAKFVEKAGIKGNLFNDYNWGGYLAYQLYPKYQVFVDGRAISIPVLRDYQKIYFDDRGPDDEPLYSSVLEKYQVEFIIQPYRQMNGSLQPLLRYLLKDNNWVPVHVDTLSYVYVRRSGKNSDVIDKYGMDNLTFATAILRQYDDLIRQAPTVRAFYEGKHQLLTCLGRTAEAEEVRKAGNLPP